MPILGDQLTHLSLFNLSAGNVSKKKVQEKSKIGDSDWVRYTTAHFLHTFAMATVYVPLELRINAKWAQRFVFRDLR